MTAIASTGVYSAKEFTFDPVPQIMEGLFAPVMQAKNCRQGGIACLALTGANAGYYQPGATATGLLAMGRFEYSFDNTLGQNGSPDANGVTGEKVRAGIYSYNVGTGADAITQANVGQMAYIIDDQTVGLTDGGGTRSPAGPIVAIDPVSLLPYIAIGLSFVTAAQVLGLKVQVVRGVTLVAGTATVGGVGGLFSLTSTSVVIPTIATVGAGTQGTHYQVTSRVTGAPGTAQFVVNAVSTAGSGVLVNTDVNTLDFLIVG
jgi:hypothetical protein